MGKLNSTLMKVRLKLIFLLLFAFLNTILAIRPTFSKSKTPSQLIKVLMAAKSLKPQKIVLKGIIGKGADASCEGRLKTLTTWNDGKLLAIFNKQSLDTIGTDWLGEHVGKWMYTAARAANRTNDPTLLAALRKTADYLVSMQESDGYLGTYAPAVRFTSDIRKNFDMTWDIWAHSYLILGFLEINRYWPNKRYLNAAIKIGDLLYKTFYKTGKSVAYRGNHFGASGTILLEPIIELYMQTGDQKYINFGKEIVKQVEARPELQLVSRILKGTDLSKIGEGKIYQLCWNYVGIAKLYEVTGNPDYLEAVQKAWQDIVDYHLTLGGGPWGGIGKHHECFNRQGYWSPYGFVETCNTMSWIQLNRELFLITGEAKYTDMIEKTAYNALLGAQYPDGEGWCYFSFPNGKRHLALYRACCRSSGALALEEISPLVFTRMGKGLSVNIYTESEGNITLLTGENVEIIQKTDYPFNGKVNLVINLKKQTTFPLFLRIPDWADEVDAAINNKPINKNIVKGNYLKFLREWKRGDKVVLNFPMRLHIHKKIEREVYRSKDIYRIDWVALTRGPLVYATNGLIDGKEREKLFNITEGINPEKLFSACPTPSGFNGPAFQLTLPNKNPIMFLPYYEAGGRFAGRWRLTWLQTAVQ
ncbi:glycoside hydrolase family 127 protein [bacterium]|nr:glycoside hydrolase family 127 protein [bacterium]